MASQEKTKLEEKFDKFMECSKKLNILMIKTSTCNDEGKFLFWKDELAKVVSDIGRNHTNLSVE